MNKSHSLSTSMIMRSFDIHRDSFWSQKKDEEFLGDETLNLSAIRVLMHLPNNIQLYICFARFSFSQIKDIKMVLSAYLNIFEGPYTWVYSIMKNPSHKWLAMKIAEYLFEPHKARYQTHYLLHIEAQLYFGDQWSKRL